MLRRILEIYTKSTMRNRKKIQFVAVLWIGLMLAGCMSIEQMAPPVGPQFYNIAIKRDTTMALLESGREVYLVDCSRCHSVEPIQRYSMNKWHEIIPRMAQKSKLSIAKSAALRAYIVAVSDLSDIPADLN